MGNVYREAIEAPSDRVIVALDNMNWAQAEDVMSEVAGEVGMAKANSIAQKQGWEHTVHKLWKMGVISTMADTKFHDIPKTVELQVKEVTETNAALITVHASGGKEMLEAAVTGRNEAIEGIKRNDNQSFLLGETGQGGGLLGITVLTSIGKEECESIYGDEPEKKVLQFARIALEAGLDGIVCSGKELKAIRSDDSLSDLITVVPGITPEWTTKASDQKRVVTPKEALQNGADYLVIGRAITQPPEGVSRTEAAQRISQEIAEAL